MKTFRAVLAAATLCVAVSFCSFAQSDVGTITGFVRDPTGAVIPNAKVTVTSEATREQRVVNTDAQGHYTVPNLRPGLYTMTAESQGFKKFSSSDNKLNANSTIALDGTLTVGATTETIEVTDTASQLQTESGAVQNNINAKNIQAQELNGRNPLYMASLLPGVRSGSTLGDFNFSLSTGGYAINGARTSDSQITMDGAPATRTRGNGTSIGVANVDATQEIQVLTADYAAEYGRSAGGQIRIVTKGGSRDFHGSGFEYFRNSDLNANTWTRNLNTSTNFANPFRYNDFGFNIGGPVAVPGMWEPLRDKFFFFVGEEWTRYRYTDTQTQAVPTNLMRQGNFSELLNTNPWYKGSTQLYYPSASCPTPKANTAGCVPISGNVIPTNLLSANGLSILNAYPAPTAGFSLGTANWIAQAAHPINQRKGTINGDILPSDKHRIEWRRTDFSYFEYQPFDGGSGLTGKYFDRPNQTNSVGWTWTINPTTINEARATVSVDDVYIPVNTSLAGFNRDTLGINFPYIFPSGKDIANKIPTVNVPNFYGLSGGPYPSHSSGPIYTASDSLTKVAGNHTFKVGFYFERSGENDYDQINVNTVPGGSSNQNGTFVFTDSGIGTGTTGVGLANLAFGRADSYTEIGPRAYTVWRGQLYEAFAQDSWKVTPKLTINYGVRETTNQPFSAAWGNADYFDGNLYNAAQAVTLDPKTGNVILGTGNAYNGVVIPGLSQFPGSALGRVGAADPSNTLCAGTNCASLFNSSLSRQYVSVTNQFQPRFGLAYQIDNKTVIRAGGGRFLTRMGLLDNIFPGGNSPFQPFVTVNNVTVDNPGASLTTGTAAPLTITTLNPNLKPPEAWNWNATFQRELPFQNVLSLAYVGHRGLHGWQVYDINQPQAGALQANPGVSANYLRPFKGFSAIQEEESVVNSMYHSFQLTVNRRFTNGFSYSLSYTLAKSWDNGSNYRDIAPSTYNTSNLWGPSEYDTRHVATINYTYDLPFFKAQNGWTGKTLGGWEINGIVQFQTGTPCSIAVNSDYAGVGEYGSFGCGSGGQFWNLNGVPTIQGGFAGPNGTASYFSAQATQPTPGTFNLSPGVRDSVYGPGFQDWNIGLFKTFAIKEQTNIQFRAEAFDFINHPNWAATNTTGGPNFNPTSGTFGRVTGKSDLARNLQLSLKFNF